jgi:hypothetical protein
MGVEGYRRSITARFVSSLSHKINDRVCRNSLTVIAIQLKMVSADGYVTLVLLFALTEFVVECICHYKIPDMGRI